MPQLAAAAWASFSAAAAATAASVTATLTAAGMAAGTAATIGGIVGAVNTAVNVIGGVMSVASALGIGQKQPQLPSTWSRTQMTIEAAPGLRIAVGETALGGILRANFQTGRKKEIFSEVIALSSAGPIGALHGLIIERQLYTIATGSGLASGAVSYAPNDMWCYYRLGAWDQASLTPWPGHGSVSQPPGWGADHRGAGVAHMFVVCRENPEAFPKGKPRPLARVSGHTGVIDPRTGTTASAEARDLAACWEYTWRLGLSAPNGVRLGGHFKTLSQIDTAAYAAWANRCEELDLRVSGQIDLDADDVEAVSRALMQAGCASYCLKGGKDSVIFQSVKTSVGTITEADLAGPIEIITSPEIRDRPNGIIPSFASAAHGFEVVPGSMVTATEYQTEDGGLRQVSLTLPFVSDVVNPDQAGIVAAYQLVQSRERLYVKGAFHPRVLAFGPGDAVTLNLPSFGVSSVKCILEGRDFGPSGAVTLALRSETDSKHAWAVDQTSTPPDTTLPQLSDGLPPQPESGQWTATAAQITAGGTNLPIIRVTGSASDYPQGSAVVVRYRLAASGSPWLGAVELGIDGTAAELSTVTPGTAYVVGVAYRNGYGREGTVRELASVTTGTLVAGNAASVPWDGVTNPTGTRPENNATVGARIGTNLLLPDSSLIPVERVDNTFVSPATSGYVADLAAGRYAQNRLAAAHFSNLATLPGITPLMVNSSDQESWNPTFFRDEFLPRVFGSLDVRRFIFSMCEWTGYWWLPLGTKLTSYPRSHAIAWNGVAPFGAWWHDFAGGATILNSNNILIALQEAAKWRERGVVIGTSRGNDFEYLNDEARVTEGFVGLANLTLSVAGPPGTFGACSSSIAAFGSNDIGWTIRGPGGVGLAEITSYVAPTLVGYRVIEAFAGTSISAGSWLKQLRDPLTNGAQLWLSATGTGTRTAKASLPSFSGFTVGQELYNRFGPGRATITAVTNSQECTVDVTEDFGTQAVFPHTWTITGIIPLTGGMTVVQRRTKVATETLQIIAQAIETYGSHSTLVGFYFAHEPDSAKACAAVVRMICKEGAGGFPPLESYRRPNGTKYEFWVAPASPIDCLTDEGCLAAGAALADSGLTHWHPQDTTGAGSDLTTGAPLWESGVEANLAGLPEMARRMRIVASRANCVLALHDELWSMTGVGGYTNATPARPDRYARQVAAYGSRGDIAAHYQLLGYVDFPSWTIKPRQSQAGISDFATRAAVLGDTLVKMVGSPSIVAAGPTATVRKRSQTTGISVPTGTAWTTLASVTVQEAPLAAMADLSGTLVTGAAGTGNITAELRATKDGALIPGSASGSFLAISGGIMTAEWTLALETTAGVFSVAPGAGTYALQARIVTGGAMSSVNTTIDVGLEARL